MEYPFTLTLAVKLWKTFFFLVILKGLSSRGWTFEDNKEGRYLDQDTKLTCLVVIEREAYSWIEEESNFYKTTRR